MAKQVVGLKIGAAHLAAARVSHNGSVELVEAAHDALPSGIVQGGEVRDVDALAASLENFFKKYKLPKKNIRVGIGNNRMGVRMVDIEGAAEAKQLTNAVRFRALEALPIPLEEAVLDYQVLSESVNDDGESTKKVLMVVAYRDLVEGLAGACRQAGLKVAGIDLEAFALLRSLMPVSDPGEDAEPAATVVVGVGHDRSTLAVSEGFTCEYTRVLDWGGAQLTKSLANVLDFEEPMAERVKRQLALDNEDVPAELTPEQAEQGREALKVGLQAFARELVSSLQFYQGQPNSLGIREVILAGGTANLPGLAEQMKQLVGVNVRVGDPASRVGLKKQVKGPVNDPSLAVPIGLGMGL